jgi:signal transduction histidine kinase
LELHFDYDNRIPILIKSDPNRLRQIITNLLGNALKFTQKGAICLKAKLDDLNPSLIHLFIVDNGIGIKEENKKKLFTAFGKVQDGENEYLNSQGVGLGLLISNKLAISIGPKNPINLKMEMSNFNLNPGLNVTSEFGKGATFRFI